MGRRIALDGDGRNMLLEEFRLGWNGMANHDEELFETGSNAGDRRENTRHRRLGTYASTMNL